MTQIFETNILVDLPKFFTCFNIFSTLVSSRVTYKHSPQDSLWKNTRFTYKEQRRLFWKEGRLIKQFVPGRSPPSMCGHTQPLILCLPLLFLPSKLYRAGISMHFMWHYLYRQDWAPTTLYTKSWYSSVRQEGERTSRCGCLPSLFQCALQQCIFLAQPLQTWSAQGEQQKVKIIK